MTKQAKPPRVTNEALARHAGSEVACRVIDAPGNVVFLDDRGAVHWFDRGALRTDVTAITAPRSSMHYTHALYAIGDVAAFLDGVDGVSERAMQWSGGDSTACYREAIRYRDRVLLVWGRNNARDLQSIGITTTEADARGLIETFRRYPPTNFKPTGSHYLEGRGGVVREYWPPPSGDIQKGIGNVLDHVVTWKTLRLGSARDARIETCESEARAAELFDRWELEWFRSGGRPYEVEWMKTRQRRADRSVLDLITDAVHAAADPARVAAQALEDAGLVSGVLPSDPDTLTEHIARHHHATHWLRGAERLGRVEHSEPRLGTQIYFDPEHLVVATVVAKKSGQITVKVKRDRSLDKATARWKAAIAAAK